MMGGMTYDESVALIKDLMSATTKDELQGKLGENVEKVDATFFMVVNDVAASLRAQGKPNAARRLTQIGDTLARLRFMI
jgi:site-specific recombinase